MVVFVTILHNINFRFKLKNIPLTPLKSKAVKFYYNLSIFDVRWRDFVNRDHTKTRGNEYNYKNILGFHKNLRELNSPALKR